MKTIRLVTSDIDGTLLLNEANALDTVYFEQITALKQRGIRFAAASGRQYANLRRLFAPVADDIDYICENGSLVVSHGDIIAKTVVSREIGAPLLRRLLATPGCEPLLSGVHTCYVQPKTETYAEHMRTFVGNHVTEVGDIVAVQEEYLKISAFFGDGAGEEQQKMLAGLAPSNMRPVVSGQQWLDFLPEGCDKGTALAALQTHLGISREETMSFGDNENDMELLQQSGIGCCMRGGHPQLLAVADKKIDNVADELMRFLETLCKY